jgi:hypothetical protein
MHAYKRVLSISCLASEPQVEDVLHITFSEYVNVITVLAMLGPEEVGWKSRTTYAIDKV